MNKKLYMAPEIAEVTIPGKLMLSVVSEPAQEVLSRRNGNSFDAEEEEECGNGSVW